MAVVATIRREGETNERVIGRWKRKAQAAKTVEKVRGKLHFKKKPNSSRQKEQAIVREKFRSQKRKNQFYV